MAHGINSREPTVLIHATTLTLKYLMRGARLDLFVVNHPSGKIIYGVKIFDDIKFPAMIWSAAETPDELRAIRALSAGHKGFAFLFNEAVISTTWGEFQLDCQLADLNRLVRSPKFGDAASIDPAEVGKILDGLHTKRLEAGDWFQTTLDISSWHHTRSDYITNRIAVSTITLQDQNEGNQQEELALWFIDNLDAAGAYKSPYVRRGKKLRELTDLALSHQYGAILIESKALGILDRPSLPSRQDLVDDITKHLKKARDQLVGAVRALTLGHEILASRNGPPVKFERKQPPHCIILVPDLTLLDNQKGWGRPALLDFMEQTKGFLHILDPNQLLRIVQAAEIIEAQSSQLTRLEAFDYYLMERFKQAVEHDTPNFDMLLRFE
jgi:hypothetical protein